MVPLHLRTLPVPSSETWKIVSYYTITQPKTLQTWCKLCILPAWSNLPTSCIKPVDFIKLDQVVNIRLSATWYLQTCCKLMKQLASSLHACSSQLAASLLRTCNRLVIIKPEQAMRTHPDIGLMIRRLAATCALLAVYSDTAAYIMKFTRQRQDPGYYRNL